MTPSLADMSGETQRMPRLPLNELRFNGQTGKFVYRRVIDGAKEDENGNKRIQEEELGENIDVIFLKIRRRLFEFRKDEKPLITNEHNHKGEVVALFGNRQMEIGDSDTLRENHPGLRTEQVVYCIYNGELVRLRVKGSALGSQNKAEDVHDFYSYISSFKDDGRDDHFYECYTHLYPVQEQSDLGPYKTMSFKEGEKLSEEDMKVVEEKMTTAYNFCQESDDFIKSQYTNETPNSSEKKQEEQKQQIDTIEYPEDDVNPDDIPF